MGMDSTSVPSAGRRTSGDSGTYVSLLEGANVSPRETDDALWRGAQTPLGSTCES